VTAIDFSVGAFVKMRTYQIDEQWVGLLACWVPTIKIVPRYLFVCFISCHSFTIEHTVSLLHHIQTLLSISQPFTMYSPRHTGVRYDYSRQVGVMVPIVVADTYVTREQNACTGPVFSLPYDINNIMHINIKRLFHVKVQ